MREFDGEPYQQSAQQQAVTRATFLLGAGAVLKVGRNLKADIIPNDLPVSFYLSLYNRSEDELLTVNANGPLDELNEATMHLSNTVEGGKPVSIHSYRSVGGDPVTREDMHDFAASSEMSARAEFAKVEAKVVGEEPQEPPAVDMSGFDALTSDEVSEQEVRGLYRYFGQQALSGLYVPVSFNEAIRLQTGVEI